MYSKCKCCISIVPNNNNTLSSDTIVDNPFILQNISHRLQGYLCTGIHPIVNIIDICANMTVFNILITCTSIDKKIITIGRIANLGDYHSTLHIHTQMIKHMKNGGTHYTDEINQECINYKNFLLNPVKQKINKRKYIRKKPLETNKK
jgi:hypothetical protein